MDIDNPGIVSEGRALDKKIDAAAWGFLFVWIGVALLAHVGWGIGLIGVGLITLGAQAWRKRLTMKVDRFALIVGALFVVFGLWNLLALRIDLVPLLFIAAGVCLLAATWRGHDTAGHRRHT